MGAYSVVAEFEETIAKWAGAKYGVAVESCTMAIFLSLKYFNHPCTITLPNKTYPGVAMSILNAGYKINFTYLTWNSFLWLQGTPVIDSALRFKKDMYLPKTLWCLSFHYKKHLPIGRGGMLLTDDKKAYEWLKMARFDGRKEMPLKDDNASIIGWNAYMTPEQAARGLCLFEGIKDKDLPDLKVEDQNYPDLSTWRCFS
jgi:dTDP-4-amino-4,6-dideoxygalactose transaminase